MHAQRILGAVLNWGLGHATRSQVLIRQWLEHGSEVWIAADGEASAYLKRRFPECVHLDGIPTSSPHVEAIGFTTKQLYRGAWQMHQLIQQDQRICKALVAEHGFDLIVSDSRLGFHAPTVHSILITHQLSPRWPWGMVRMGQSYLNRRLSDFDEIWVPDDADGKLSGDLSHGSTQVPVRYIGPLSRFKHNTTLPFTRFAAIILSGPEPARSHFARRVIHLFEGASEKCVLLGNADPDVIGALPANMEHQSQTTDEELETMIQSAKHIISRSGYSTLMDLHALGRKAVLIPTSGQSEQEYLGELHRQLGHTVVLESEWTSWKPEDWMQMLKNRDAL